MAASKITVPVLWDLDDNFFNSTVVSIDADSVVVGIVSKPTKVFPPMSNQLMQSTLQISELSRRTLYLNITLSAYQALIRASSQSVAPLVKVKVYQIASVGPTITDTALSGATILAVWKGGIDIDPTGMLSGDVLTFTDNLEPGDTVGVIYYTN